MHGDQLLLLAQGAEKTEGVRAEPERPDDGERREAEQGAREHAPAFARTGGREHEERQNQPSRGLDSDPRHERGGRGFKMRRGGRVRRVD